MALGALKTCTQSRGQQASSPKTTRRLRAFISDEDKKEDKLKQQLKRKEMQKQGEDKGKEDEDDADKDEERKKKAGKKGDTEVAKKDRWKITLPPGPLYAPNKY